MTKDQESHLHTIKQETLERIDKKYRAGQKGHGGNLWQKNNVLEMAIDEAIDQVVYLLTLKKQQGGSDIVRLGFGNEDRKDNIFSAANFPHFSFSKFTRKKARKRVRK